MVLPPFPGAGRSYNRADRRRSACSGSTPHGRSSAHVERLVPGGVNVGFARPRAGGLDLGVWERGAGLTDACGTGACAAAVAAVRRGDLRAGTPAEVRLPGGSLFVTVGKDLREVEMKGPAERVFAGETSL